jgi:death-on-curing protein
VTAYYLDLADFLIIAEKVLGIDTKVLAKGVDLAGSALCAPSAAFAGVEFYEGFPQKAAILVKHPTKNHPLPNGTKRTAYACFREFVSRNNYLWQTSTSDEVVAIMVRVTSDDITTDELAEWISAHLKPK